MEILGFIEEHHNEREAVEKAEAEAEANRARQPHPAAPQTRRPEVESVTAPAAAITEGMEIEETATAGLNAPPPPSAAQLGEEGIANGAAIPSARQKYGEEEWKSMSSKAKEAAHRQVQRDRWHARNPTQSRKEHKREQLKISHDLQQQRRKAGKEERKSKKQAQRRKKQEEKKKHKSKKVSSRFRIATKNMLFAAIPGGNYKSNFFSLDTLGLQVRLSEIDHIHLVQHKS